MTNESQKKGTLPYTTSPFTSSQSKNGKMEKVLTLNSIILIWYSANAKFLKARTENCFQEGNFLLLFLPTHVSTTAPSRGKVIAENDNYVTGNLKMFAQK